MRYLILFFVFILSSCSLIFKDEPYDPGVPTTPIIKSIPFTCDGTNYVKMGDEKILGYGGPYMMMNNDMLYTLDSNKLSIIDCNKFKIISSHKIGNEKIIKLADNAALKNNKFWLLYSTDNSWYVLSLVDSTGNTIHTIDIHSMYPNVVSDIKISATSENGCIVRCVDYNVQHICNFDENGNVIWNKTFPCDYDYDKEIYSVFTKIVELKSKEFLYCTVIPANAMNGYPQSINKITKLDKDGNIIWVKQLPTTMSRIDNLIEQSENSYLISDGKVLNKVDSTGTFIWQSESSDYIYIGLMVSSDGSIVTSYDVNDNGGDIALSKISDDGKIEWTKTFGGTGIESINNIFELSSGGYYLIGGTNNLTGKWVKILKTETDSPYKQYYVYWQEYLFSYYFIKTDNMGNSCN